MFLNNIYIIFNKLIVNYLDPRYQRQMASVRISFPTGVRKWNLSSVIGKIKKKITLQIRKRANAAWLYNHGLISEFSGAWD